MNLAIKDIRANLFRFLLTCFGLGLMLMASMAMTGLYRGIVKDALAIIDDSGADLWVIQADTEGPFAESSQVDRQVLARTLALPGVVSARQFTIQSRRFVINERPVRGSLLGLDFPADRGTWIPLIEGRPLEAGRAEAIADESTGLRLGDEVSIDGTVCSVVGLAQGYLDSSGNPIIAVPINDALEIMAHRPSEALNRARQSGRAAGATKGSNISAVMLTLAPHADLNAVKRRIEHWGDVVAMTADEERTAFLYGRLGRLRGQILMFTAILLMVTAVVISVTIYTMTMEKRREIALLKLIGARNGVIVSMILQQAVALGAVGFAQALLLGPVLAPLFPRRLVQPLGDYLYFSVIVLALCVLGAGLGIWKALQVRAQEVLA